MKGPVPPSPPPAAAGPAGAAAAAAANLGHLPVHHPPHHEAGTNGRVLPSSASSLENCLPHCSMNMQ